MVGSLDFGGSLRIRNSVRRPSVVPSVDARRASGMAGSRFVCRGAYRADVNKCHFLSAMRM